MTGDLRLDRQAPASDRTLEDPRVVARDGEPRAVGRARDLRRQAAGDLDELDTSGSTTEPRAKPREDLWRCALCARASCVRFERLARRREVTRRLVRQGLVERALSFLKERDPERTKRARVGARDGELDAMLARRFGLVEALERDDDPDARGQVGRVGVERVPEREHGALELALEHEQLCEVPVVALGLGEVGAEARRVFEQALRLRQPPGVDVREGREEEHSGSVVRSELGREQLFGPREHRGGVAALGAEGVQARLDALRGERLRALEATIASSVRPARSSARASSIASANASAEPPAMRCQTVCACSGGVSRASARATTHDARVAISPRTPRRCTSRLGGSRCCRGTR